MKIGYAIAWFLISTLPAAAADPIATTDGEQPGHKIEITELKRSGDVLTLKFRMVNEGAEQLDFSHSYGDSSIQSDYGTVGAIHLIDEKNKKKYFVMRDEKKVCVCSRGLKTIAKNGTANLWARFPAPPDSVEKISVVVPHFLPLDDVPISK